MGVAGGYLTIPLCIAIGVGTAGVGGLACSVIAGAGLGYVGSSAGGAFGVNEVESSCMKLSVINFIIMHRNSIGLVLLSMPNTYRGYFQLFTIAFRKINLITLCSLFVEKFGARPVEALIYQDGGSFSRLCVMHFY